MSEHHETPAGTDRRQFLATSAAGIGAAATLAACGRAPVRHAMPYLVPPEDVTAGVPVHYASTCTACPAACGLLVTVLDGRPVKLEGNPAHPHSKGGLCASGQAHLRALYDAKRISKSSVAGSVVDHAALDAHVAAKLAEIQASGKKLYVLAPTLTSPTMRETLEAFLAPYGGVLVEHDAGAAPASALLEAYETLTGRALAPAYEPGAADLVVTLGADPLGTGAENVAFTRAWADRRAEEGRPAARLVAIEGSLSLSGANADERWMATAAERRRLALWLAARLGAPVAAPDPHDAARANALLAGLRAAGSRALVLSGSTDRAEQLAVALVNRALGAEGTTLDLARPSLVRRGLDTKLAALLADVTSGAVGGLFVLDADPVDDLPNGAELAKAIARLPLSVAITDRPTATASACDAVAAAHHGLERWSDFSPRPGVLTIAQPAVRPIFDTRDPLEWVLRWSGAAVVDPRLHLIQAWKARTGGGAAFDAAWSGAVRKGGSDEFARALPAVAPVRDGGPAAASRLAELAAAKTAEPALEAELVEEVGVGSGRHAHVPWLRELPDPLTRVAWTPCARLAPERAKALGVLDGDLVRVDVGGRAVVLAARVMRGQHPNVVAVPVGYGRHDGAGDPNQNAYALSGAPLLAATVTRTGGRAALPLMQTHDSAEGRPLVHQVPARDAEIEGAEHEAQESLWPDRPITSPKWEMVIDLDRCTGCSACVVACQAENNLPVVGEAEMRNARDMYWLRMDRYFVGDQSNPDVLFTPMLCAQCDNAPCETVCPVAATVHSEDGLNQQVYNRCVGTRYCANNCPYKVRRFNWFDHPVAQPVERLVLNPNVVPRDRGVMEKCTFCVQRIQGARIAARRAGQDDWRIQGGETACQQSCPARAITFGDATQPKGEVARKKEESRAFQVLAELGVKPAVTYLAKVRTRPEAERKEKA